MLIQPIYIPIFRIKGCFQAYRRFLISFINAKLRAPKRIMSPKLILNDITAVLKDDIDALNSEITDNLNSDIELVNTISSHIISAGGKRLRPLLLLLVANACGYEGSHHVRLAAIVELIHTATLLHDDVVDLSELRRGMATANSLWGDQAAVLVGDFLYSRSFQMMVSIGNLRVMEILADATNQISEGEVQQLINIRNIKISKDECLQIIANKTARLFQAAASLGAIIAGTDEKTVDNYSRFGTHLGIAFQLIDDVLDYNSSNSDMGKSVGDDLAEGKPTMPLIHAMAAGKQYADIIEKALEESSSIEVTAVIEAVNSSGAIEKTIAMAKTEISAAKKCLAKMSSNQYNRILLQICDFALERTF